MSLGLGWQYDSLVLGQRPLSYWPARLAGGSDLGPRGRDLVTGGLPAGASLLATGETGATDYPDGVGQQVTAPELDLSPNPCIDLWYRLEAPLASGFGGLAISYQDPGLAENFFLGPVGTEVWWRLKAGTTLYMAGAAVVGDTHHLCAWWEDGILYADLDGRVYSQVTPDTPADVASAILAIGQSFDGSIGKVAVWNRPPTAGERLARLKAGLVGGASWR